VASERLIATLSPNSLSKEALHVTTGPPPRLPETPSPQATVVPLDQLWTRIPSARRQELLGHLTRILAPQLAALPKKEAADE
jgi:hypothetical protein